MKSTRRSLFTLGALLAAVALLVPGAALAQPPDAANPVNDTVLIQKTADKDFDKLDVVWQAPADDVQGAGYRVYYMKGAGPFTNAANALGSVDVDDGGTEKATITGLEHETEYTAAVAALDEDGVVNTTPTMSGDSNDAGQSASTETAPAPSTPRNVEAMGGDEEFTLSWGESFGGGTGLTVKEYRVQKREVAGNLLGEWIPDEDNDDNDKMDGLKVAGDMTMVTIGDLENGVSYEGRVRAVNSAGVSSDWSTRDGDMPDDDATAMVGDDDDDDDDDMTETPALPLVGILLLGAGLVTAGRRRLRR